MDGTLLDLHFDNHSWREYVPRAWPHVQTIEPFERACAPFVDDSPRVLQTAQD